MATTDLARKYYVYVYFRPSGAPCYVGKGSGRRHKDHHRSAKNRHLAGICKMADAPLPVVIVRANLTESEAFEIERALIAAIGREAHGGPLVNLTDGGEGFTGARHSLEARQKMSAYRKGRPKPPGHAEAVSAALTGIKHTPERRKNISTGTRRAMQEGAASEKISAALSGRTHSAERRSITSEAIKRKLAESPEFRESLRRAQEAARHAPKMLGKKHSAETRAKMSAAHRARLAQKNTSEA